MNETAVSHPGQLQPLGGQLFRLFDVWQPADARSDKPAPRKWSRRASLLFIVFTSTALWVLIAMALYMLAGLV